MPFLAYRAPRRSFMRVAAVLFLVVALQGCTEKSKLESVADAQAKEIGYIKENLAKLIGRVTVDGQPPAEERSLVVILNDPEHLDATANGQRPTLFSVCNAEGKFAIMTKPGKYIVTFAELHQTEIHGNVRPVGRGPRPDRAMTRGSLLPPDDLKNLYNDPDRNAKENAFQLDLQLPGKEDYQVDLAVAGKDPVDPPGPHAVTRINAR
jgi:hypothetical protein